MPKCLIFFLCIRGDNRREHTVGNFGLCSVIFLVVLFFLISNDKAINIYGKNFNSQEALNEIINRGLFVFFH